MTWTDVLLLLTVWRITYMLVEEDGPFYSFYNMREALKDKFPVFECFHCTSVWIALIFSFATPQPLLYWLPLSVGAIFIYLVHEKLS